MTFRAFRSVSRLAAAAVLAVGIGLIGAGAASAHVSVDAGGARQGEDDALLTFRVPNERSGASTVQVDIRFPIKTPIASVKPAAKPGWTVTTKRTTLTTPIQTADGEITQGVTEVVFKASSPAAGVQEDTFETFELLVGPLPTGVSALAFPTVQTYSNGDVSSWIEPTLPGTEPAHPAPLLKLAPGDGPDGQGGLAVSGSPGAAAPAGGPDGAVTHEQVRTATFVGMVGVVVGSIGLLGAGIAIGRSRRQPSPPASEAG
jgi:periplasmic copper chaperone A